MKNFFLNISLAKKLSFLTLAICLAGALIILTQVYRSTIGLNEDIIKDEIHVQRSLVSSMYIEPLWNFSENRVAEVSNSFMDHSNGFLPIVAIKVVDYKGQTIFIKDNHPGKASDFDLTKDLPFEKINTIEIKKEGQILGTVITVSSYEGVINKLRKNLVYIFIFSMLTSIIVSFCIYLFFNNLLIKPLKVLLGHITQIENENYDYQGLKTKSYEMLLISNSLNKTSQLIKKRNEDLKHYTENLERMVTERTGELESMTVKNVNSSRLAAVGEMASGMAHEINNPLAIIGGQVYKLKAMFKANNQLEEYEAPLKAMTMMIERIAKIIKGLKNISRDGQADPLVEFSVRTMMDEIIFLTEMKIKSHDIKFDVAIDPSVELAIGREVQISQVLVNLINNAVDAIRTIDQKWVKIEIADKFEFVEFKITDSGSGISTDISNKIMQPFFTTKEVGKGTGLGLSISRGIIEGHGGEFFYNNKCDNTQFVFTIKSALKKSLTA
ncbi:MAG: ATP-binding protein [Bacteriovorax sp.]|nr:ATP-binding protein [Bacteriovorax sp.]